MSDGTAPVSTEDVATSGTLSNPFAPPYLYSVYSFGETSGYGYCVTTTENRTVANEQARKYRGVVTRQEIIGDFRELTD